MIKLHFPVGSCFERNAEVCSVATPHARGALASPGGFTAVGPHGPLPTQNKVTARWPDGSVKWLVSLFEADLPANAACDDYRMDYAPVPAHPAPVTAAVNPDGSASVLTGALTLTLGAPGTPIFRGAVQACGAPFTEGEIAGPEFRIGDNTYTALTGTDGWRVTEDGPIRVRLETRGKHTGSAGEKLDFQLAVCAWAGKPYIQLEYRFIHCEEEAVLPVTAMGLRFRPETEGTHWMYATSNYRTAFCESGSEPLHKLIDSDYLRWLPNEQAAEVHMGTFFADWRDGERGLCTSIYQAYQNFPKAFDVAKDGYTAWIVPGDWGSIDVFQGMAKTTRMLLHFYDGTLSREELDTRSQYYSMPDKPSIPAQAYLDAGMYREFFPERRNIEVELYLRRMAEGTGRSYGMMDWGDYPDGGYTAQGRGHGSYVWTNNEYDYAHQAMIEYARTGSRLNLDRMLVAAEHQRDVDICHYSPDPLLMGGQHVHSRNHVEKEATPSHEWVEGLLDYYHVTGDAFTYQTALGVAENVEYLLENRIFNLDRFSSARESGWALRTFCAMYNETGDGRWLRLCDRIVSYFDRWEREYGAFIAPYTSVTMARVPFMISIAAISLHLYYRIRPSARLKELILHSMDDLMKNCMMFEGGFLYYKELPSLQVHPGGLMTLELASICYELSGDRKYIEAFVPQFGALIRRASADSASAKTATRTTLTTSGDSPKRFAQYYPCIMRFYRDAIGLGLISEGVKSLIL